VIDVNKYPLKQIEEMTKANRKIGLGVMGWADMLIQLGIPYNSKEALRLAEEVMRFISEEGRKASTLLAQKRGVFPNWSRSIYAKKGLRLRNATITTIAPTGSLSIIAGCSSGIEPLFAVCFVRNVLEGTKLLEINPYFERIARQRGFYSRRLMEEISSTGTIRHLKEVPDDLKRIFLTAHDITPEDHIRMQAAFQRYVDNAVSKTVNFPNHATAEDVEKVYLLAYELGCKGVTVYRDGSREEQVLRRGIKKHREETKMNMTEKPEAVTPRPRPEVLMGYTIKLKTGCGSIYVTINVDETNRPFEVFTRIGKSGGCAASQSEAVGRLVSTCLRAGMALREVVKQLKGISCHQPVWGTGGRVLSCSDAIGKALERFLDVDMNGKESVNIKKPVISDNGDTPEKKDGIIGACPECSGPVEYEGGCAVCHACGYTRC
jgi:ribonucleoside-diphosphate reductase alpha chain